MINEIKQLGFFRDLKEDEIEVTLIKEGNHVYRIKSTIGSFFLKTYTKGWYGPPESTGFCVLHEKAAYEILHQYNLNAPEVVLWKEKSGDSPLHVPFLITREVPGEAIGQAKTTGQEMAPLLRELGVYLRKMHSIEFQFPGYVMSAGGPQQSPEKNSWRHRIWEVDALEIFAKGIWRNPDHKLKAELIDELEHRFDALRPKLIEEYAPPRMIHGDCHLHQFFFDRGVVSGVVDMECASAGDRIADLVKLFLEAASKLAEFDWLTPFVQGYGQMPNFETFQLRLLCCEPAEFCAAGWKWNYNYDWLLQRMISATSWKELFALSAGREEDPNL